MTGGGILHPVSSAQQQVWFLERLHPGHTWYNIPVALRLRGRLDREALCRSLNQVVVRHEALRTSFTERDSLPYQVISPRTVLDLPALDLAGLAPPARAAAARDILRAELGRPFDLRAGPLVRARLIHLGADDCLLLLSFHHLIFDGWSLGVFLAELGALYQDPSAALPGLPAQYRDYVTWQRERAQTGAHRADIAYWTVQLAGLPRMLDVPTDRPRGAAPSTRGGSSRRTLPAGLASALAATGAAEGATLFMVLLAAYATLLGRYAGQDDICVGCPIAARTRDDWQPLIGFFVNTLPLRIDLSGRPSFRELLRRARDVTLDGFTHLHAPFETVAGTLARQRGSSYAPLYQAMFAMQTGVAEPADLVLPGLRIDPVDIEHGTAKSDLTLGVGSHGTGGLTMALEYSADLFEAATAARMLKQLHTLLEGIVAAPAAPLARLPLLDAAERGQVLGGPGTLTAAPSPAPALLHSLFERHAAQRPDAPAIVGREQACSYAELDARANQLGHLLQALGVEPEVPVAICLDRTPDVVMAIMGVLKAGGAYVPLDPGAPAARLSQILTDAAPPVVITRRQLRDRVDHPGARLVVLDEPAWLAQLAALPARRCASQAAPENLAYIIYTSGSSGQPKGVMVSHGQVTRLLAVTEPLFGFTASDTWTMAHSPAFDYSVWEMWGALANGGRLAVVPEQTARSPHDLLALLVRERVTVLCQTPSGLRGLTSALARDPAACEALTLRVVISGGEALTAAELAPWFAIFGQAGPRIVNMYGITETTVHATYRPMTPADATDRAGSPIGAALRDLRLFLLDEQMEPVADGAPGELYVAGSGLARGYLRRPALTAGSFLPHPFSTVPGSRLYRTGDRARRSPSGDLEYLGRLDQQVKMRGYRIELTEIEAALRSHPGVSDCAVSLREDTPGDQRLIAYVVPSAAGLPPGLRQYLAAALPGYAVPARYVAVAAMPLTRNGKLDRGALPRPAARCGAPPAGPAGEAGRIPDVLCELYAKVLGAGAGAVGLDDDFFALGGNSIAALRLTQLAAAALSCPVRVGDIYQAPTVRELATLLAQPRPGDTSRSLVSLIAGAPGRAALVLVHPAGGGVDCYLPMVRALGGGYPVFGIVATGLDPGTEPQRRIENMAATYLAALDDAALARPLLLAGWSFGGVVAFEMAAQMCRRPGGTPPPVLLLDSRAVPFTAGHAANITAADQVAVPAGFADPKLPSGRLRSIFRVHLGALAAYRPAGPYPGQLTVLRAHGGPDDGSGPDLGWRRFAAGEVATRVVPGHHDSMLHENNAAALAEQVRPLLSLASRSRPEGSGIPG